MDKKYTDNLVHAQINQLLERIDVPREEIDSWETDRLLHIEKALAESIYRIKCCYRANESNRKKSLGRVFTIRLEKADQTSWIFENFYGRVGVDDTAYDTVQFKKFLSLHKVKSNEMRSDYITASVSLYITDYIDACEKAISTHLTATKMKNSFCDGLFWADKKADSIFLKYLSIPFLDDDYDKNGDVFFENPLSFRAQYDQGKTSTYYIVGANYSITSK